MGSDLTEYLKRVRYSKAAVQNHGRWGTQTGSGHVNQRLPSRFPTGSFSSHHNRSHRVSDGVAVASEPSPRGQVAFQNRLAKYLKSQSRSQPCLILLCQQLSLVFVHIPRSSLVGSETQTLVLPVRQRPWGELCPVIIRLSIKNSSLLKCIRGFQGWILLHMPYQLILSYTARQ